MDTWVHEAGEARRLRHVLLVTEEAIVFAVLAETLRGTLPK